MKNIEKIVQDIYVSHKSMTGKGELPTYIPALSAVNPDQYAISVCTVDGETYNYGDYEVDFSIQSISKVFTLAMLMQKLGDEIWSYVGKEPSGSAFNSLIELQHESGIPRNPFINAGALVITDRLIKNLKYPKQEILDFIRLLSENEDIYFDKDIAKSEIETSFRNAALANLMKSFENIENNIEKVIDTYCHQCSISMNTQDLAKAFLVFANYGLNSRGEEIFTKRTIKRLNSLMLTCGLYNESGEFAYRVGLPGKSGVGGGIAALIPGKLSIAVWSPELNKNGNSYRAISTLEELTTNLGIAVF